MQNMSPSHDEDVTFGRAIRPTACVSCTYFCGSNEETAFKSQDVETDSPPQFYSIRLRQPLGKLHEDPGLSELYLLGLRIFSLSRLWLNDGDLVSTRTRT